MTAPQGRWLHSFEEDHDGIRVYRPDTYPFPRARGRGGIEFSPEGKFVDWGPGRADAPEPTDGVWVSGAQPERFEVSVGERHRVIDIVTATPDKLELRIGEAP